MEVGESCSSADSLPSVIVHAIVQLKSVTFAGNHPVEEDTHGNFAPPEWLRGRTLQRPVCYTRGRNIRLTATFDVLMGPTATEDVTIRARLTVGSTVLEWSGSVSVAPDQLETTTAELTSSAALPNQVDCLEPAEIEFFATSPSESMAPAGSSRNVLYVVLGDPSGTPAYWTLLDISCRGARGATTDLQVFQQAFSSFGSLRLTRMRDGKGLTYWNPDTTTCTNTAELLASGDGSGQCGSWSELLVDMYKAHGITSAQKVLVVITQDLWLRSAAGFLVKNWTFIGPGSHPAPWTHEQYKDCKKLPGIPGQNSPNPPPAFFNHFIVKAGGVFYDPSYGGGPTPTQLAWETGAIDGLFTGRYAGYPKASYPTTALLQFWNAVTGAPL